MTSTEQITLYWHDYETWGESPAIDRPVQFAGVRTDLDLNILGEPLTIYARPAPDVLPKPEACLITGITPQEAEAKGVSEADFIAAIHRELARPGTCGVGYNSIRFDDEVTRYTLYRNFYDPYEREWRNGNSRWDLIDVLRMTRALRPEGIHWPDYEDGTPCFKLERLTEVNRISHEAAHDALSDVHATIAMARLLKSRQPKLYDYAFRLRDKRFAASLIDIDGQKPLLHISSRFPGQQGNAALVLPLAYHPANKNSVIAFNLAFDPSPLLNLPVDELRIRLFTASADLPEGVERLPLKEIHLNKTPMLVTTAMVDETLARRLQLDMAICEQHLRAWTQLTRTEREALAEKLDELYSAQDFTGRTDPEQQLYAGFFSDADKRLMSRVRTLSPDALAKTEWTFEDSRLPELLFRYRARNFPESLDPAEQQRWFDFCCGRLTRPDQGASLVLSDFRQRIHALLAGLDVQPPQPDPIKKRQILKQLQDYADSLEYRYCPQR
ncbi:exodeoxyribonuclease I [Cellvibrio japonicus]|uniref:Exodeoxyribonuclease I n=1 Tax=Cellvibrio japonicus (strain Ueda107) TaxID=498211 RepID=B3PLL7_CELJU|nr:exodeoxyribonuclease I [Cellvibrio japonicus]ACE84796.1 exodeoxyribonuclease I [Cellvibrio japonicus Ueda107]QEI13004.1 exodeoxyribonuclease I [Cellvibrio japonicus]QEI16578.1 exodeoxyribonuclease I [Cellvibrio japonicus]QEI20156.1 exodeoxyribonuclease I [Cellvibrio japonicus]